MEFDFGNDYESPTLDHSKEQPQHAAVIAPARRRLEDRAGLIDREHGLLDGESALASTLLDVGSIVEFIRHRALRSISRLRYSAQAFVLST